MCHFNAKRMLYDNKIIISHVWRYILYEWMRKFIHRDIVKSPKYRRQQHTCFINPIVKMFHWIRTRKNTPDLKIICWLSNDTKCSRVSYVWWKWKLLQQRQVSLSWFMALVTCRINHNVSYFCNTINLPQTSCSVCRSDSFVNTNDHFKNSVEGCVLNCVVRRDLQCYLTTSSMLFPNIWWGCCRFCDIWQKLSHQLSGRSCSVLTSKKVWRFPRNCNTFWLKMEFILEMYFFGYLQC